MRWPFRPKLRLIRAFSLLLIFRGIQVMEAATIESATWASNRRALESKMFVPSNFYHNALTFQWLQEALAGCCCFYWL